MDDMSENKFISNDQLIKSMFAKFLLPSIFALMASNLSSMIDTVILGNVLGEAGLAAMSLVTPVYLVYFTIGSLVAVGSSIMAGMALGENRQQKAEQFFGGAFALAVGLGVLLTVCGMLLLDPIVSLLGASGELVPLVKGYCRYYILGGTCTLLFYIPFNFLRMVGKPKSSMLLLITMGTINVLLTLLFVIPCRMSVGGAALATVISLGCAFALGCVFLFRKNTVLKPRLGGMTAGDLGRVVSSGSAAAFNNLSRAVTVVMLNAVLVMLGTQSGLTIYTVSRSINDLFLTVILGISQSILPLVSLFYGEKDNHSIRLVMKQALKIGNLMTGVCALAVILLASPLCRLFGADAETLGRNGLFAVLCVALSFNLNFINTLFSNYYSATRHALISNLILLLKTVFLVASAYVFGRIFGAGAVWLCFVAAELFTLAAWWLFALLYQKRRLPLWRLWLLERENDDKERNLVFSVKNTEADIMSASEKVALFCEERELPVKKSTLLSLSVEELLLLISGKCLPPENESFMDLRLFITREDVVLRIRCGGRLFNPIRYYEEDDGDDTALSDSVGVGIIMKTARHLEYREILGVNNLLIVV